MLINHFFFSMGGGRKRPSGSTREAHDVTCKTGRQSWPNTTGRPVLNPADEVQNIHFFAVEPCAFPEKKKKNRN